MYKKRKKVVVLTDCTRVAITYINDIKPTAYARSSSISLCLSNVAMPVAAFSPTHGQPHHPAKNPRHMLWRISQTAPPPLPFLWPKSSPVPPGRPLLQPLVPKSAAHLSITAQHLATRSSQGVPCLRLRCPFSDWNKKNKNKRSCFE